MYDEYLPLECKDCNIQFKEDHLLTKHEREVHGAEKIVICQFCNRKYKSRMELVQHICAVHFYRVSLILANVPPLFKDPVILV